MFGVVIGDIGVFGYFLVMFVLVINCLADSGKNRFGVLVC